MREGGWVGWGWRWGNVKGGVKGCERGERGWRGGERWVERGRGWCGRKGYRLGVKREKRG